MVAAVLRFMRSRNGVGIERCGGRLESRWPESGAGCEAANGGRTGPWPLFEKTEAAIVFEGANVRIERFSGEAGTGRFEITGGAKFSTAAKPSLDIRLHGE